MASYHCNNCGINFSGDEFEKGEEIVCPDCQSDEIEKTEAPISGFIKRYWILLLIVSVLIIVLLMLTINGDGQKKTYQINFTNFEDGVKIQIEKWVKENEEWVKAPGKPDNYEDILSAYNFRIKDNKGRRLDLYDGKFYPCPTNQTDTISIEWQNSSKFPLNKPNNTEKILYFEMEAENPNSKANCEPPPEELEITGVNPLPECSLKVTTNKDATPDSADIRISIHGVDGTFRTQRIWDAHGYNEINVWATLENDTTGYVRNGDVFNGINCDTCNLKSLRKTLIQRGNKYGKSPDNKDFMMSFGGIVNNNGNPTFYINGEEIGVWDDFSVEVRKRYFNDGTVFEISDLHINEDNCIIQSIEFTTIN